MAAGPSDASDPVGETQETYDLITAEWARQNAVAWPNLVDHISILAASLPPGGVVAEVGLSGARKVLCIIEENRSNGSRYRRPLCLDSRAWRPCLASQREA